MHIGVPCLCVAPLINIQHATGDISNLPEACNNVTLCNNEHENQFSHSHTTRSIRVRLKLNAVFNYVGHGLESNERNDRNTNSSRLPVLGFHRAKSNILAALNRLQRA